jgi:mannose-1-phosphate guanylyltransferase
MSKASSGRGGGSAFIPVIMAGGRGQRFWPLSTVERPKQFLDLERSGRTMLQATYERLLPLAGEHERMYVATGSRYVPLVREQLEDLPGSNVIVEPTGRDSAPAVALASLALSERLGPVTLGFFSSDHRIEDETSFREAVRHAISLATDEAGLVTLGIAPTRPATAYGYVERGEPVGDGFRVRRFVEKPDAETAAGYLRAGTFAWNAGIFVWRSDVILAELDRHAPDIMGPLRRSIEERRLPEVFPTLPARSIDYAVMEHTDRAFVVPVDCGWDDVGDWVALERVLRRGGGEGAGAAPARHVAREAAGNLVFSEDPGDLIVTLGVDDLVVVKRGGTVLVAAKDRLELIRTLLADGSLE